MSAALLVILVPVAFLVLKVVRNFSPEEPVDEAALANALVTVHRVRRRMDVAAHRAQIRRDADLLRRELRAELGGGLDRDGGVR